MPHDKNGRTLVAGDEVLVRARVKEVMPGDEYCNVNLETIEPMYPGTHASSLVLNTRQVELVTSMSTDSPIAGSAEPVAEPVADR